MESRDNSVEIAHRFLMAHSALQLMPRRVPTPLPSALPKFDYLEGLRCGESLAEVIRYLHDEADSDRVILHRFTFYLVRARSLLVKRCTQGP